MRPSGQKGTVLKPPRAAPADARQQHRVAALADLLRLCGVRVACGIDGCAANQRLGVYKLLALGPGRRRQHLEACVGDLGSDAVATQYGNLVCRSHLQPTMDQAPISKPKGAAAGWRSRIAAAAAAAAL